MHNPFFDKSTHAKGIPTKGAFEGTQESLSAKTIELIVFSGIGLWTFHHIAGSIVAKVEELNTTLEQLSLELYRRFSELCEADMFEYLDPMRSIQAKHSAGSTNPEMVRQAISDWRVSIG